MARQRRNTKRVDYSQFNDPDVAVPAADDSDDDADVVMLDVNQDAESADDVISDVVSDAVSDVEIDDDIHELVKPKTKKPKKAKTSKSPEVTAQKFAKKEVTKTKDITSIKDKFLRFFGSNNQKLVELVKLRKKWERSVFNFDKSQLADVEKAPLPEVDIPETSFAKLSRDDFDAKFPLPSTPKNLQFNTEDVLELPNQSTANHGHTIVLNTGSLITDIAWSNVTQGSNSQILAVGISNITETTTSGNFKLLEKHSYPSVIQLYEVDTDTKSIKLIKSLLHNWGNVWDLKFVPIDSDGGVLSGVFNDGSVRVINLENSTNDYLEIKKPSFEYSIPGHLVSCYDWLDESTIICGTDTGHIAEFSISDENDVTPSYFYPLHSSYVYSISAAVSKYDETLVFSLCSDGLSTIFSPRDIITTANKAPRSRSISKTVVYSPQLYSFVHTEGPYSTKVVPIRAIFGSTSLTKHDGSTESLATSAIHPLVLSGGADGKIKVTNLARRLLCTPKQSAGSQKILTLFELQYGKKENVFRLVEPFDVEKINPVENISVLNIYPPQVSINSLSWNSNKVAGNWFAAGSTSGLLILHEL
jgi:transcription factor C subunit 6